MILTVGLRRQSHTMPSTKNSEVWEAAESASVLPVYAIRKRRNRETQRRQVKVFEPTEREAKRKLLAQREFIRHPCRCCKTGRTTTDEHFGGSFHARHHLALLHENSGVFFCNQCGTSNSSGTQRLLKSQRDGSGESRRKARRKFEKDLMPNARVRADAKTAVWMASVRSSRRFWMSEVNVHRQSLQSSKIVVSMVEGEEASWWLLAKDTDQNQTCHHLSDGASEHASPSTIPATGKSLRRVEDCWASSSAHRKLWEMLSTRRLLTARWTVIVTCGKSTTRWRMAGQLGKNALGEKLTGHQVFLDRWWSTFQSPRKTI